MKLRLRMQPAGGLWWTALVLAVLGGLISYVLSLDRMNLAARSHAAMSFTVTIVAVGICVICATSGWWLRR